MWRIVRGDCRERMRELDDACVDAVITDPPYDDHTHGAQRQGCTGVTEPTRPGAVRAQFNRVRDLGFAPMTSDLMAACATEFARVCRRWVLVFCSLEMISDWRIALESAGLQYVRAQIWHRRGGAPQFSGDRPAQACEAIVTAHPRGRKRWNGGGHAGFYDFPIVLNRSGTTPRLHTAQKPVDLMRALVERFSNPGETILDPFCGSGTTGVACVGAARSFLGIELEEKYATIAEDRIRAVSGNPEPEKRHVSQLCLLGGSQLP